jgi:hypothetical protein
MNAKLTLRLDKSLIESAKIYAASHGSSVSQIVANYFAALGNKVADSQGVAKDDRQIELGPVTRSLVGILKAPPGQAQVSEDDYHAYLERKFLGLDGSSQTGSPS